MARSCFLGFLLWLVTAAASAQTTVESTIPTQLKDWRPWVTKDLEYRNCPFLATQSANAAADFLCAWPSRLNLAATADGATFAIHWRVEAPTWVPLPGSAEQWPQQVTVNGQRQPVLSRDNTPSLWLAAGNYEIAGRIPWRDRPQTLTVPARIGLVTLSVDGKAVAPVQRENGEVTLGRGTTAAPEADSVQMRVFRKLADGIPATLTTQINVFVSGQAREEVFGPVLPQGFTPLSLSGEWPARIDDDGRLHVQVQPGGDTLTLEARSDAPLAKISARVAAPPWPKQEIWSYEAAPELRVTAASGAVQVDPRQAGAPEEWFGLPAFALTDGGALEVEQRSRGLAADEGNRVNLHREAWLDFSGDGWYARDRIDGEMRRGWRFDVATPFVLERAEALNSHHGADGGSEALLVTRGATPELSGVEWRTPQVQLSAGVHIASAASALPVAGWRDTFDSVDATLHFPFGYKLLAAPGADTATGSWMSGWSLLDAFVCAILVLLAWRHLGVVAGVVAVAYLLIGYQESQRPFWILIVALALALIGNALPLGKLRQSSEVLRRVSLGLLVLFALPFVADEIRFALYPQLEENGGPMTMMDWEAGKVVRGQPWAHKYNRILSEAPVPAPPPAPVESPPTSASVDVATTSPVIAMRSQAAKNQKLETIVVTGSKIDRSDIIDHYSESTVVQTGTGEPSWNLGSTANLSWTGPVLATQTVHLLIAPPWLVRILRIALVALLGWLAWRLFRTTTGGSPARPATPLAVGILLISGIAFAPMAIAQGFPSDDLLNRLRQRLTEAPKCAPACASVAEAQVTANGDSVTLSLDAQAGERIALPLPGGDTSAMVRGVKVDGVGDDALVRGANGSLWVTLSRGVHRVDIEYTVFADKFALAFPLKPARVLFKGNGWESSGLNDDRLLAETLNLSRARTSASDKTISGAQQFPPYVRIERNLTLGLEWSVTTSVRRIAPAHGGFTVTVPALAGEHVTSAGVKVENGKVLAAFGDSDESVSWHSNLDKGDALHLTAPPLAERAEVWRVVVSPTWHAKFSGVPETVLGSGDDQADYRNFEFSPLPGETLDVAIERPAAVQGETRAIDSAAVASASGQHASTHTLTFTMRASQGGEQSITLPADAEVLGLKRDGQALNLRPLDGKLSLPVMPGVHTFEIGFREPDEMGWLARTPDISLGLPAANIAVTLSLPADRWLLGASGPQVGPAILYWGELVVMVLVAFALSRTRRTRLGVRDWFLLGIGFSTFSWAALLVVVAWLFAFDWRKRSALQDDNVFNLTQIGLAALTVVALLCLISAIPQGLLGEPDMHVAGNGSSAQSLSWFVDRSADALPRGVALSAPMWVYKVLMLAWALWLANALIGWLRDAFAAWSTGGYWRNRQKSSIKPAVDDAKEPAKP